jgi:hypothetical protein
MIPTARNILTRPPTGTPRRAICPCEGLPISYVSLGGSDRGCLLLRASNEHRFIVRVLRARKAPGHSLLIPSEAAHCASTGTVPATPSPFFSILLGGKFDEPKGIEVLVKSFIVHQLGMVTGFYEAPFVEDENPIGSLNSG